MTGILERMNVKPRCVNQSVLDALAIKGKDFYILLAVHSNIMIVHFYYQLDAQILYFNNLLHSSTCFEYSYAHLQEDNCISTAEQSSRNLWSEQSPKESDDTRCCVNTIVPLKMSIIVLETCRGV